ncbi:hypothetical protein OG984_02650 [Nocardioides sp. NBC_00368]|uniref:hypothetical protein n=1 Tax=Nocardioides sp. NBC_00368 TaxID=2976000 RepID=UPI002E1F627A
MSIDPNLRDSNVRVSKLEAEIWLAIDRAGTEEYAEILEALTRVTARASSELRKIGLGLEEEQEPLRS